MYSDLSSLNSLSVYLKKATQHMLKPTWMNYRTKQLHRKLGNRIIDMYTHRLIVYTEQKNRRV